MQLQHHDNNMHCDGVERPAVLGPPASDMYHDMKASEHLQTTEHETLMAYVALNRFEGGIACGNASRGDVCDR